MLREVINLEINKDLRVLITEDSLEGIEIIRLENFMRTDYSNEIIKPKGSKDFLPCFSATLDFKDIKNVSTKESVSKRNFLTGLSKGNFAKYPINTFGDLLFHLTTVMLEGEVSIKDLVGHNMPTFFPCGYIRNGKTLHLVSMTIFDSSFNEKTLQKLFKLSIYTISIKKIIKHLEASIKSFQKVGKLSEDEQNVLEIYKLIKEDTTILKEVKRRK